MDQPPEPTAVAEQAVEAQPPVGVQFPNAYLWLVLVSAMDLMLTWGVIGYMGAIEANPLAQAIYEKAGFIGMTLFKFGVVAMVIAICEFIARHAHPTARKLAFIAIAISAFPVVWTMLMMFEQLHG